MDDAEIYVGEYFVSCFSTEKKKLDRLYEGCQINVVGYIEEPKAKKKSFGKKPDRNMHMRLNYDGRSFGRVSDD